MQNELELSWTEGGRPCSITHDRSKDRCKPEHRLLLQADWAMNAAR